MLGLILLLILSFIESYLILKKKIVKGLYLPIAVLTVILVIYSQLTYGQTFIHSDVATPMILLKSMADNHSFFPKSFNYANGDLWVLSLQLLCVIPSIFIKSQTVVRMLASAQFVLLAVLGIVFLSRKIFKDNSWTLIVPIVFLMITGERSQLIWEAGYIGIVLWIALIPSLFFIVINGRYKLGILYCLLLLLLVMAAPMRYAAELILPLTIAFSYTEYMNANGDVSRTTIKDYIVKFMILIAIPTVVGKLLYDWICSRHNVNLSISNSTAFVASVRDVWENIQTAIVNLYSCFGYTGGATLVSIPGIVNLISIFMCTLVCFVVPYLQIKKFNDESIEVQFFFVFSMMHNVVLIMTCIFFGQVEIPRYLLTTVVICIYISGRYIYKYWLNNDIIGKLLTCGFIFCVLIEGAYLSIKSFEWQEKLSQQRGLSEFILENNLDKGYATYWNAYTNEIYSNSEVEFGAINIESDGLSPFYWLVDNRAFEPEDTSTFLLLTSAEHDTLGFNIAKTFGSPVNELRYDDYYIIVFNHDIILNMKGVLTNTN